MTRLIKSILLPGVLLAGLVCVFSHTAQAAKWSVHVHGHSPAYHGTYGYGTYGYGGHGYGNYGHGYDYRRPYGYYYQPRVYYPYPRRAYYFGAPSAVHVYGAPVVVPAPTIGIYYGRVRGPRPIARYHVW